MKVTARAKQASAVLIVVTTIPATCPPAIAADQTNPPAPATTPSIAAKTPPSAASDSGHNAEPGENNRALIERLMQQNEDARRQISTIRCRFERSTRSITTDGERHWKATGSAQHSGKLRWVETSVSTPDQAGRPSNTVYRVALNEDYSAVWMQGTRNANLDRHTSIEQMPGEEKEKIAVCGGMDYLLWGFGLGEETWRQAYQKHPTVNRWTAEPLTLDSGQKAYRISRFSPYTRDPQQADMQFLIEPERGSLITQLMWYSREGRPAGATKLDITQVPAGGHWVPVNITETRYRTDEALPGRPLGQVTQVTTISLRDIEINQPIPASQFTWEALELLDGTDLVERAVNGNLSGFVYQDGKLVPLEDVDWEQRR